MGMRSFPLRTMLRALSMSAAFMVFACFVQISSLEAAPHNAPLLQQPTPADLFGPPSVDGDLPPATPSDPAVTRYRFATVNFELLDSVLQDSQNSTASVKLNLFNDVSLEALYERTEILPTGGYAWIGTVSGIDFSQVIIIVNEERATASVRVPGGNIQVVPEGGDMHSIRELDESQLGAELDDTETVPQTLEAANVTAASAMSSSLFSGDDGSIVDVMVVYGPDARAEVGGTAQMLDRIALGMTESNTTLENSGASFRYRLVHTYETTYTSSGSSSEDLDALTSTSDGFMDEIHGLRDQYGADLVSLWLKDGGCGRAWLSSSASYAFSIARLNCATGNLTFGHEFGHNFGARHDWYVDVTTGAPTYDKGFVDNAYQWRTMMAYWSECWDADPNPETFVCTRVTQISNPSVSYNGSPTGTPEGTSTACTYENLENPDCDADNMKVMNDRAFTVANFRERQVPYAVEQIGPLNSVSGADPIFEWYPDGVATDYVLAIFDEGSSSVIFYNNASPYSASVVCSGTDPATDTCSVQPSVNFVTGVAYRWLVLALNGTIEGPWSIHP